MSDKKQMLIRIPSDLKSWLERRAALNLRTVSSELQAVLDPIRNAELAKPVAAR